MRKKILLIVSICISAISATAQKFQGSLIAGAITSQVSGDKLDGFDKSGVIVGGAVALPLSEKFGLGMEMIFIQKGSKKGINAEKEDYSYYRMSLNYAEVPIVFEYISSKRFRFHIAPTIGVLLSSKEEDTYGDIPENQTAPFEKYEVGIAGGMSFFFSEKFSIKLRLAQSVLPIRNVGIDTQYMDSGQYNSAIELMLQYHFKNKQKAQQNNG